MSAVNVARDGLCRMIASGELACGQPLPSEIELCERLGVSRSSLREAQKMLVVAGVLTARPGSRTLVSEMAPHDIMAGLEIVVPLLPLERFLGLFPMREVLEGHAAAQAAARMNEVDRKRLAQLAEDTAAASAEDAQVLDAEFHQLIISSAGDPMIAAFLGAIRKRARDYRIFECESGDTLKQVSDNTHRRLAAAIGARDVEAARFIAMEHVRRTRLWLEGLWPGPTV